MASDDNVIAFPGGSPEDLARVMAGQLRSQGRPPREVISALIDAASDPLSSVFPARREPTPAASSEPVKTYRIRVDLDGAKPWDASRTTTITVDDVHVGGQFAQREVDEGLYRSRWERATAAQRQLLRVLAELGGEAVPVADLAAAMGKKRIQNLSVARDELIKKGLLYASQRGVLAFTVPGMHAFIAQQDDPR